MKKFIIAIFSLIIVASVLVAGCGNSKPSRPSVLNQPAVYTIFDGFIQKKLSYDDTKCKNDLNGKVVDFIGIARQVRQFSDTKESYIMFAAHNGYNGTPNGQVMCIIKNDKEEKFQAVRGGCWVHVKGYATVSFSNNTAYLWLRESEVIDVFNRDGESNFTGSKVTKYMSNKNIYE